MKYKNLLALDQRMMKHIHRCGHVAINYNYVRDAVSVSSEGYWDGQRRKKKGGYLHKNFGIRKLSRVGLMHGAV